MVILNAFAQKKILSRLQFKCKKIQAYDVKIKIRQTLTVQMIFCTTAAFITGAQAMEDDMVNHCTRVGGKKIHHTVTPGEEIIAGTMIYYDADLPKNQQLNLWPQGRINYYTCPAVPGIKGLEKPRPMGFGPKYGKQEPDSMRATPTGIELIKSSCNRAGVPVFTGLYLPAGTVNLSSKIDNDQRIDTKELTCLTGKKDHLIIDFEYKEFMYHIPHSFAFSKGCLTRENPNTSTVSPCFTFSCWVLPARQGREIFSWSYLAPEAELKGQKKRMAFGIDPVTHKATHRAFLKLPIIETSTKDKVIPTVTKVVSTPKTILVEEKYVDKKVIKGVVIVPSDGVCSHKVRNNVSSTNAAEMKKLGLNLNQIRLVRRDTLKLPGVTVNQTPWMAARKNGKLKKCGTQFTCIKTVTENKVRKVPKKITENTTVVVTPTKKVRETIKTLKEDLKFSSEFTTSATHWIHLLLFVDGSQKSMKVHVNGKESLTVANPNIISLNELCSLQIGDSRYPSQILIADINVANGQNLNPSAFCNVTSQGTLTPKNFTGPFGKNGFQLRGGTVLDTSPNKTQWKANGSVSFPLKSPTTL